MHAGDNKAVAGEGRDHAQHQDYVMEEEEASLEDDSNRQFNNLMTLNAIILSDPTLANMLIHGQGLQQMANSLAEAGSAWFDNNVMPNGGIEPRLGVLEVDTFYQQLALMYPTPRRSIHNPDMDNLAQNIVDY